MISTVATFHDRKVTESSKNVWSTFTTPVTVQADESASPSPRDTSRRQSIEDAVVDNQDVEVEDSELKLPKLTSLVIVVLGNCLLQACQSFLCYGLNACFDYRINSYPSLASFHRPARMLSI